MRNTVLVFIFLLCTGFICNPLPNGNLLSNPWFHGYTQGVINYDLGDGWVWESPTGLWTSGTKGQNPTGEDNGEIQGHSARFVCFARHQNPLKECTGGYAGTGTLSQIVVGQGAGTYLFGHAWGQFTTAQEWRVYGMDEIGGPMELLWVPHKMFAYMMGSTKLIGWHYWWSQADLPDYNYYKVQLNVDLLGAPLNEFGEQIWDTGTKHNGIYFGAWDGPNPAKLFPDPNPDITTCWDNICDGSGPPPCEGERCEPPPNPDPDPEPCTGRGCPPDPEPNPDPEPCVGRGCPPAEVICPVGCVPVDMCVPMPPPPRG
jgi:hypothetical protein